MGHTPLVVSKVDEPVESAPKVTPQMQCAMRTEKTKNLKRGRKPKGKKGKKAVTSPKRKVLKSKLKRSKHGSKSNNLGGKRAKGKGGTTKPPATAKKAKKTPVETQPPAVPKRKRAQEADPVRKHGRGSMQDRVTLENGKWVYEVLPDQTYGCGNCRFIYGGCKVCQKPGFKGKSAAKMRVEQQDLLQKECGEGWTWDEEAQDWVQAEEVQEKAPEAPKRRKGAKKRRGSK